MTPTLRDVPQEDAVKVFVSWGGVIRRRSKRGHCVLKMPNGKIVSLPTGKLKIGLLSSQIRVAGRTEEEFIAAL